MQKDAAYPRLGQDDQHEVPGRVTANMQEVNTYKILNPDEKRCSQYLLLWKDHGT